jgi:hypothetical protein
MDKYKEILEDLIVISNKVNKSIVQCIIEKMPSSRLITYAFSSEIGQDNSLCQFFDDNNNYDKILFAIRDLLLGINITENGKYCIKTKVIAKCYLNYIIKILLISQQNVEVLDPNIRHISSSLFNKGLRSITANEFLYLICLSHFADIMAADKILYFRDYESYIDFTNKYTTGQKSDVLVAALIHLSNHLFSMYQQISPEVTLHFNNILDYNLEQQKKLGSENFAHFLENLHSKHLNNIFENNEKWQRSYDSDNQYGSPSDNSVKKEVPKKRKKFLGIF